jgi:hypothetical protein
MVKVIMSGLPLQGGHCVITVNRPDGTTGGGMTPLTDKTGTAKAQFRVNQKGSYRANVTIDVSRKVIGSSSIAFQVQ